MQLADENESEMRQSAGLMPNLCARYIELLNHLGNAYICDAKIWTGSQGAHLKVHKFIADYKLSVGCRA
jgi:hypothetical protein